MGERLAGEGERVVEQRRRDSVARIERAQRWYMARCMLAAGYLGGGLTASLADLRPLAMVAGAGAMFALAGVIALCEIWRATR